MSRCAATNEIGTTNARHRPVLIEDKAARSGIRIQDHARRSMCSAMKVEAALEVKECRFSRRCTVKRTFTVDEICDAYLPFAENHSSRIWPKLLSLLNDCACARASQILFEGAQGTHARHRPRHLSASSPSSSCCAGGAADLVRALAPRLIDRVLGIHEGLHHARWRRSVPHRNSCIPMNGGEGQDAIDGDLLCAEGHEYGVTTGRKRRCGWFDAVIASLCGCRSMRLTDIAAHQARRAFRFRRASRLCVAYEMRAAKRYDYFPMQQSVAVRMPSRCTRPCLAGRAKISRRLRASRTCRQTRRPIFEELERLSGVKATIISVGPDRDQTFTRGWEPRCAGFLAGVRV